MKTYIISIGSELVSGKTLNTNAPYICRELEKHGISVNSMITIDDNIEDLVKNIKNVSRETSLVFILGGLGSTDDDITKERIFSLSKEIEIDKNSRKKVINRFKDRNYDLDKIIHDHMNVYSFPRGATIYDNKLGTANGFKWMYNNSTIYILPGPPKEMEYLFNNYVIKDIVNNLTNDDVIETFDLIVYGLGEWKVSDILSSYKKSNNYDINTFYIDEGVIVRLKLRVKDYKEGVNKFLKIFGDLKVLFNGDIYRYIDKKEEYLVNLLIERNLKVSTAESITGGLIASSLINIAGSSAVISESYVTYSDEVKNKILGVNKETLYKYTAVSYEVCEEMLSGLYSLTNSDICIVTTGYAGPTGDVGKVFIGIKVNDKKKIFECKFSGDRNSIRNKVKEYSLNMAIRILEEE